MVSLLARSSEWKWLHWVSRQVGLKGGGVCKRRHRIWHCHTRNHMQSWPEQQSSGKTKEDETTYLLPATELNGEGYSEFGKFEDMIKRKLVRNVNAIAVVGCASILGASFRWLAYFVL